jgi:transposase
MSEEKRGRGRPRPEFTVNRDEEVFDYLVSHGASGRQKIAEDFGVNVNIVYLSLHRLRRQGRAEKVRNGKFHLWAAVNRS